MHRGGGLSLLGAPSGLSECIVSWSTTDTPGGVHVVPVGDSVEHRESESCPCSPVVELHAGTCGCWGKLYLRRLVSHHAMDGRLT